MLTLSVLSMSAEQGRRHERGRIVRLEPGGLVGDQRIGRGVRLVEAVAGELLHQVENVAGLISVQCRS